MTCLNAPRPPTPAVPAVPPARRLTRAFVLALGLLLGLSGVAWAQYDFDGYGSFGAPTDASAFTFGLGFKSYSGAGSRADTLEFSTASEFAFGAGASEWRVGLTLELEFREGGLQFRDESFDELSDFFHLLRFLSYGRRPTADEPGVFLRLGTLYGDAASLGHGTLLSAYDTEIDLDSPKTGAQIIVDTGGLGVELLVNDLAHFNVLAARTYVRPLHDTDAVLLSSMALGIGVVSDIEAPGALIDANADGVPDSDADGNLQFVATTVTAFVVDAELPILSTSLLSITPYVDYVQFVNAGSGWFAGVKATLDLGVILEPLSVQLEYRSLGETFLPGYFDAFYEVERYRYPTPNAATTKFQALNDASLAPAVDGYFGAISGGIKGYVRLGGRFVDYSNDFDDALGKLELSLDTLENLSALLPFGLHVRYQKRGIAKLADAFELTDTSRLLVAAIYPLSESLGITLGLTFERSYQLNAATGAYEPVDTFFPAVFWTMSFGPPGTATDEPQP